MTFREPGRRPGERRDPLHEIKDAFGFAVFLAENGLDDLGRLSLGETTLAEEAFPVFGDSIG